MGVPQVRWMVRGKSQSQMDEWYPPWKAPCSASPAGLGLMKALGKMATAAWVAPTFSNKPHILMFYDTRLEIQHVSWKVARFDSFARKKSGTWGSTYQCGWGKSGTPLWTSKEPVYGCSPPKNGNSRYWSIATLLDRCAALRCKQRQPVATEGQNSIYSLPSFLLWWRCFHTEIKSSCDWRPVVTVKFPVCLCVWCCDSTWWLMECGAVYVTLWHFLKQLVHCLEPRSTGNSLLRGYRSKLDEPKIELTNWTIDHEPQIWFAE